MTCVCGLPLVPGTVLPWAHAVNPGRNHHYARPASRGASDGTPLVLGARQEEGHPVHREALDSYPASRSRARTR